MCGQKILVASISGALAGLAIGILIAPASGSETRQKIADSAENLKRKFNSFKGEAGDKLDDLREIFTEEIKGLKEEVRHKILGLIDEGREDYDSLADDNIYRE